ncbi:hypothetical protein E2K93_05600 [Thalassotalea sp. HSM 43]|uniref:hypothetical protein n=1 Tax=Thalassotalea sp. HSM 43 TaxID=2552945 RepID=UPI0010816FA4|nr:hypothetical protein [Thalassotalea sp. HSM 43]QBY03887.1 hypothetical protein E2K93_05600 [Thalassotalea sp. HSM 43]
MEQFFPYKAGIQAQQDERHEEAFDIFCQLSFKGDYRAQFQMAQYFAVGVTDYIEADPVFAVLWADLANSRKKSVKRQRFIDTTKATLTDEQHKVFITLLPRFLQSVPTGQRIDMQFEPLDLNKLYQEYQKAREPQEYTGSRIKRDKPPINVNSINF